MIMQLTDARRSILEPACAREDLCVFPVPAKLKGGAVGNVCKRLQRSRANRAATGPPNWTLVAWEQRAPRPRR
jgi:hypothetical protein